MKTLFHPNKNLSGSALGFSIASKTGKLYLSFLKQSGPKKFSGGKQFNISLGEIEIGGVLNAIEKDGEWATYHDAGEKGGVSIKFSKYVKDGEYKGHSFQVAPKGGDKFGFLFQAGELRLFKSYLEFVLEKFFSAEYAAQKKRKDEIFKAKEKEQPKDQEYKENLEAAIESTGDSDLW